MKGHVDLKIEGTHAQLAIDGVDISSIVRRADLHLGIETTTARAYGDDPSGEGRVVAQRMMPILELEVITPSALLEGEHCEVVTRVLELDIRDQRRTTALEKIAGECATGQTIRCGDCAPCIAAEVLELERNGVEL